MPQFDILTIGSQVFGLLIALSFFYYYSITVVIPMYVEIKKLRTKKLLKNFVSVDSIDNDIEKKSLLINNSYKNIFK